MRVSLETRDAVRGSVGVCSGGMTVLVRGDVAVAGSVAVGLPVREPLGGAVGVAGGDCVVVDDRDSDGDSDGDCVRPVRVGESEIVSVPLSEIVSDVEFVDVGISSVIKVQFGNSPTCHFAQLLQSSMGLKIDGQLSHAVPFHIFLHVQLQFGSTPETLTARPLQSCSLVHTRWQNG